MQFSGNRPSGLLVHLHRGEDAVLEELQLPDDMAHRLMVLGFVPGATVKYSRSAPGGDPRVFLVEGAEVAIRRETAAQIRIRAPR